ncbi:MAG TPA: hypothetical protein VEY70_11435 [Metabacillus sp.]|nr:hypothetical protein [Metabacillus sp.]
MENSTNKKTLIITGLNDKLYQLLPIIAGGTPKQPITFGKV